MTIFLIYLIVAVIISIILIGVLIYEETKFVDPIYMGCYKDSQKDRLFSVITPNMTAVDCATAGRAAKSAYMGLEYWNQNNTQTGTKGTCMYTPKSWSNLDQLKRASACTANTNVPAWTKDVGGSFAAAVYSL